MTAVTLANALSFATEKHAGQKRLSGEPYIEHVKRVAVIVREAGFDLEVEVAALLHDTLEDTDTSYAELEQHFGHRVASLVQSLTQWQRPSEAKKSDLEHTLTLYYLLGGSILDLSVLAIKIADQYDNLTDIEAVPPEKVRQKQDEVKTYFLPIYQNFPNFIELNHDLKQGYDALLEKLVEIPGLKPSYNQLAAVT